MPHIVVYCPPLEKSKKVNLVEALTEAFVSTTGHEKEIVAIHIQESSYSNIGVGGKLLSEVLDADYVEERETLLK